MPSRRVAMRTAMAARLLALAFTFCLGLASATAQPVPADGFLPPPPAPPPPPTTSEILEATLDDAFARRGRDAWLALVEAEAERNGIPVALADAVVTVESAYEPGAVGGVDEVGLMQLRPGTAAMLGFGGTTRALFAPPVNVRYGVHYLAQAWRLADGDVCTALMKYRAGHGETRMSARSVAYCVRAIAHLKAIGSPLGEARVPQAVAVAQRRGAASGGSGNARWREHDRRLRAIESRLPSLTIAN